ncbi:hypothetical protein [Ideonella paludis]|uniref:hypothetical protein n=1 Tax=Ideonella paludis TaxID=1233411 RepID=UPI001B396AA1|nr:hypothetical protein [Ideonella paludis]
MVAIAFALPAWQHGQELTPRGGGSMPGKAMTQRLRHVEPAMAAKELTAKLRSSGAEVSLSEVGGKVHLRVKVSAEHLDAVSATLAAMELSLDGQGEADIQIDAGPP